MGMKCKTLFLVLLVVFLLASCDLIHTEGYLEKEQEVALMDENLELEDRILELENRIEGLKKTQATVSLIDEDVTRFFLALKSGNVDELKRRVTKEVEIEDSGIQFMNGSAIDYGNRIGNIDISYIRLIDYELNKEKGKLVYEFFSSEDDTKTATVAVEVVHNPEGWKINHCNIQS
ncbi:hypothetical protein [Bacillus sp. CECT 9360]|uniref:hypothetical protein n=1 Tax=Bacillus sp. CECT 9360 TaxID=2845821 RepID=UPI001E50CF58|nr:hypothetical protein [Bacillus sp. CECT 9360]CAH0347167.1 hypothetical protein BCI9360_03544 [Bacillus sp. CECT 9360]